MPGAGILERRPRRRLPAPFATRQIELMTNNNMRKLRVGFVGAGNRSLHAHYPCVSKLDNVEMAAICELDENRLRATAKEYRIPRTFSDHREMLDAVELDVVYCVMREQYLLPPALDILNAGRHLFVEKPPGKDINEVRQISAAAKANDRFVMVGFQRRYAAVTREAMRLVRKKGPVSLVTASFNKQMLGGDGTEITTTLWNDVSHIVDLVRFMAGGEAVEVTAFRDCFGGKSRNSYTALIRFDNGATGVVMGNRALRAELHGVGVGCYLKLPEEIEIFEDNQSRKLNGWEFDGGDPSDEDSFEGVLAMHRHFAQCVRDGAIPSSDIRDVVHTMELVNRIEGPETR
jgi:virulence factor